MILDINKQFVSEKLLNILDNIKAKDIDYINSKDNYPVPRLNNAALHSTYYPLKEADRIKMEPDINKLIIAIGFGAGYHLYNYAKMNREIIVISTDHELLKSILSNIDLTRLFSKKYLKIIDEDEIQNYFDFFKYSGFSFVIHPVLEKIYYEQIKVKVKSIINKLNQPLLEVNTQRKFGKIWFNNFLKNLIYYFENGYNYEPLTVDNKIIMVAGACPSLDTNIKLIKKNTDKLFIASTDSALKILIKNNITPDAVFSFDSQHNTYLEFCGIKNIPRLFTDFLSTLKISNKQTFLFSNYPLLNIFNKLDFQPIFLSSDTRNIGGAIIDFFNRYFVTFPIVTAGIDFGIFKNKVYSRGSYINEYINNNCGFYNTAENYQSDLLYKYKFTEDKNHWKTTELFLQYSNALNQSKTIFSLSTSPFNNFKKINSLNEINLENYNINKKSLIFDKPEISKKEIAKIIKDEINKNPEIIYSYFLSKKQEPETEVINTLTGKIDLYLN